MKLTEDPEKQTLPGSKAAFRLLRSDGKAPSTPLWSLSMPQVPTSFLVSCPTSPHTGSLLLDVLLLAEEPPPQAGQELRVWPRGAQESCTVKPAHVEPLLRLWVQQGQVTIPHTPSVYTCDPNPTLTPNPESTLSFPLPHSYVSPSHLWLNLEHSPSCP